MEKRCSKCREVKPLSEFFRASRYKDGRYPSCKVCSKAAGKKSIINKWGSEQAYYAEYRNRIAGGSPRIIYAKKKHGAKREGFIFSITLEEFLEWYESQIKKCAYCDIPQSLITEHQWMMPNRNIHRLTLDRIECEKGYAVGNICLACARCNLIKSNILTFNETREIGQKYIKPRWQKT